MLVKSGKFNLPSRQEVMQDKNLDTAVIDVTEVRIERLKKGQKKFTQARRNVIQLKHK